MAGNIRNCLAQWRKITSDKIIIDIIMHGLKLNFSGHPPEKTPFEYRIYPCISRPFFSCFYIQNMTLDLYTEHNFGK